jgi:DNA-binding HxlR family transcriptional regulator
MLRTKAQKQNLCSSCPIAKTANLIGDSCTLLILRDLLSGPKRFKEFEKSLDGISTRTLTKKLTQLVEEKIILRTVSKENRTAVAYMLSDKGAGLEHVLKAMESYGIKHL